MSDPVEVPFADARQTAEWLYAQGRAEPVLVSMTAVRLAELPARQEMAELLQVAFDSGMRWTLLDGPRTHRPAWVLDPWWGEVPEMTAALIEATQARCVETSQLLGALSVE